MKKIISLLMLMTILLCGCSIANSILFDGSIATLKSWSFQHNEGTNDYSVFFGLCNKSGEFISADVNVAVRIVNDKDEEVYNGNKSVSKNDFSYYTSQNAGEQYLANLRIPASEVTSGKSSNGTVYLTVKQGDTTIFDEVNCSALYCLPIKDIQLKTDSLPFEISIKGFDGKIESKIKIESVTYVFDKAMSPKVSITIAGTKTYANKSAYDTLSYKLYDSEGYMVKSGMIMLSSLGQGDKFKEDTDIYDITPGESYTLELTEHEY
ncbi:MAG: hypothetical protein LBQ48_00605 [Oscillospiraceae bacterium]|jgi:hypothetical protein|nr:hypothetical protein [Oscillospiraceae bacterium]